MLRNLPASALHVIDDEGHCPHISEPSASAQAIDAFLGRTLG
jgi:sigma-B regulation protein RsbQ